MVGVEVGQEWTMEEEFVPYLEFSRRREYYAWAARPWEVSIMPKRHLLSAVRRKSELKGARSLKRLHKFPASLAYRLDGWGEVERVE
jgi:hypothetical protein